MALSIHIYTYICTLGPLFTSACKWASLFHRYFMQSSQQSWGVETIVQVKTLRTWEIVV